MRLDGMREWVHSDLFRQPIALARVAWTAGSDDVAPVVRTPAGQGNEVIAGEGLANLQFGSVSTAILAAVPIPSEQEGVRDLSAEAARHVDELREANDGRARHGQTLGADDLVLIRFDDFGLPIDHQAKCSSHRDHGERLE